MRRSGCFWTSNCELLSDICTYHAPGPAQPSSLQHPPPRNQLCVCCAPSALLSSPAMCSVPIALQHPLHYNIHHFAAFVALQHLHYSIHHFAAPITLQHSLHCSILSLTAPIALQHPLLTASGGNSKGNGFYLQAGSLGHGNASYAKGISSVLFWVFKRRACLK